MAAVQPAEMCNEPSAVSLNGLNFAYPGCKASIKDVNLEIPKGSRCLLIGANGAGQLLLGYRCI